MSNNNETIQAMLEKFLPFAQERLGFKNPPEIRLESDEDNAQQPLGKTAYYDPSKSAVTVFVSGRHPKDIMRSISHELVHHTQNGRGEFEKVTTVGEGYAQSDDHLREMEREAYEQGNLCFRDWEDSIKTQNEELNMFEKRNKKINERIMKKFGYVNEIHTASDLARDDAGEYSGGDEAFRQDAMYKENEALESVMTKISKKVPVSEEVFEAAKILYWEDEWPTGALGQELYDALEVTIGTAVGGKRKTDLDADPYGYLADRLKEVVAAVADSAMEEELERYLGDEAEDPCVSVEDGLVGGKEGGIADCPDEEPEMEMEPEEELEEATGFDKDFGDEFGHLFEDSDDDDDGDEDLDGDAEDNLVPYLEENGAGCEEVEPAIVVTVGEGLYDNRNKLLHERLTKWSSK